MKAKLLIFKKSFMENLRKSLFVLVFFAVAIVANAQFNLGVKAGFNASTIRGLGSYDGESVKFKPGFHAGLMARYMFTENMGLESGLYYSLSGAKEENKDEKYKTTYSPSYLQLPVSFLYKINIGEGLTLNPSLGLYLGYGIGGKMKFEDENYPEENQETDFFGKTDGEEYTNRFDMGATVGLNLQFEKFMIGAGYDYGLTRVNKEKATDGDKNIYIGNLKVSVGYLF